MLHVLHRESLEKMVSQLESAMDSLIKVFHTYSTKEGDKYKLSKAEMKSLLQGELSDFLAVSKFSYAILQFLFQSLRFLRSYSRQVKIHRLWIR